MKRNFFGKTQENNRSILHRVKSHFWKYFHFQRISLLTKIFGRHEPFLHKLVRGLQARTKKSDFKSIITIGAHQVVK